MTILASSDGCSLNLKSDIISYYKQWFRGSLEEFQLKLTFTIMNI